MRKNYQNKKIDTSQPAFAMARFDRPTTSGPAADSCWWSTSRRRPRRRFHALSSYKALRGTRSLRGWERWLLIFDNAQDPAVLGECLPGGGGMC